MPRLSHLVPELKLKYQNADRISGQLARIMRTLLLKRLDSSFHAFTRSLGRFRDATRAMLKMFENGTIYIAPNLNVSEYIIEDREEELIIKIQELQPTDPTIRSAPPHISTKPSSPASSATGKSSKNSMPNGQPLPKTPSSTNSSTNLRPNSPPRRSTTKPPPPATRSSSSSPSPRKPPTTFRSVF